MKSQVVLHYLLQELSGLWKVCCTEHHLQPNKLDPAPGALHLAYSPHLKWAVQDMGRKPDSSEDLCLYWWRDFHTLGGTGVQSYSAPFNGKAGYRDFQHFWVEWLHMWCCIFFFHSALLGVRLPSVLQLSVLLLHMKKKLWTLLWRIWQHWVNVGDCWTTTGIKTVSTPANR